jgi:hypothetical protein
MKKFLVGLMIAGLMLAGCAGMGIGKPELLADYYITLAEDRTTHRMDVDDDFQFVKDWEANGADVVYIWVDEYRGDGPGVFGIKVRVDDVDYCGGMFVDNLAGAMSPEYKETSNIIRDMAISCARMDESLEEQLIED